MNLFKKKDLLFFILWSLALIIKLIFASLLPMSADESYYWVWSQNLQLSYLDHPPMISWLLWLSHPFDALFGHSIRWLIVLIGNGTYLIWYFILKKFSEEASSKSLLWLSLALCSPLLGMGSLIATPDVPLVFFWSLSLLFFINCIEKQSLFFYAGLGVSLGLGFVSKYHIVLFLPSLLLFLIFEKEWRKIKWKYVPITIFLGLIFSSPVSIWNYLNDFQSFKYQINHGLGDKNNWKMEWTLLYLFSQILLPFPLIFWQALKNSKIQKFRILFYFTWTPLLFFFFSSFRGVVETNWPIISLPCLFALAVVSFKSKKSFYAANIFWLSILAILIVQIYKPFIPYLPSRVKEFSYYNLANTVSKTYTPIYFDSYQIASSVWYSTKIPHYKLRNMSRYDFFDTLPGSLPKEDLFYLLKHVKILFPSWLEKDYTQEKIESLDYGYELYRIKRK